jgi:hypothetical protein
VQLTQHDLELYVLTRGETDLARILVTRLPVSTPGHDVP